MYQKISAPYCFDGHTLHNDGRVLIANENGTIENMVAASEAGDDVLFVEGCISPGFVNAHCHVELSHLKGRIVQGTGMAGFLEKVLFDRQAHEDVITHAMHNACDEMTGKGIVAVADVSNLSLSAAVKVSHGLYWHNFIEVSGFVPENAQKRFNQGLEVATVFHKHFPAAQVSIAPHAPYSVSRQLMKLIADQHPVCMSIHNQESFAENEFIRHASGDMLHVYSALGIDVGFFTPIHKSSPHWWAPLVASKQPLLLVHNCYSTAEDADFFNYNFSNLHWCLCPNANKYIGNKLPDVNMLLAKHASLCLGTDSLASNGQLSILDEMITLQDDCKLDATILLQMATANGAKALGISNQYGNFLKGSCPGVLHLEGFTSAQRFDEVSVHRLL